MPQLDETRASVVMNICESHQLSVSCDTEDAEGSRGVSDGPAQGGDVGATMETQCPVRIPLRTPGRRRAPALHRAKCGYERTNANSAFYPFRGDVTQVL